MKCIEDFFLVSYQTEIVVNCFKSHVFALNGAFLERIFIKSIAGDEMRGIKLNCDMFCSLYTKIATIIQVLI